MSIDDALTDTRSLVRYDGCAISLTASPLCALRAGVGTVVLRIGGMVLVR